MPPEAGKSSTTTSSRTYSAIPIRYSCGWPRTHKRNCDGGSLCCLLLEYTEYVCKVQRSVALLSRKELLYCLSHCRQLTRTHTHTHTHAHKHVHTHKQIVCYTFRPLNSLLNVTKLFQKYRFYHSGIFKGILPFFVL